MATVIPMNAEARAKWRAAREAQAAADRDELAREFEAIAFLRGSHRTAVDEIRTRFRFSRAAAVELAREVATGRFDD